MAAYDPITTAAQPKTEGFIEVYRLLDKLISSLALDKGEEYLDCLTVFPDVDWKMKPGENEERFNELKAQGNDDEMSMEEMDEFMDMVLEEGPTHVYHTLHLSEQALAKHWPCISSH